MFAKGVITIMNENKNVLNFVKENNKNKLITKKILSLAGKALLIFIILMIFGFILSKLFN